MGKALMKLFGADSTEAAMRTIADIEAKLTASGGRMKTTTCPTRSRRLRRQNGTPRDVWFDAQGRVLGGGAVACCQSVLCLLSGVGIGTTLPDFSARYFRSVRIVLSITTSSGSVAGSGTTLPRFSARCS